MVAKHVNKKNADKPRILAINALLHSRAALAATFSAVACVADALNLLYRRTIQRV